MTGLRDQARSGLRPFRANARPSSGAAEIRSADFRLRGKCRGEDSNL
jgi:hypothetical protein